MARGKFFLVCPFKRGLELVREERFMNVAAMLQYALKESGPLTLLGRLP
jgi:hypothetical protein